MIGPSPVFESLLPLDSPFSMFLRLLKLPHSHPPTVTFSFCLLSETPPEDESHKVVVFGSKMAVGQVEATVIILAVAGIVLFLIASFLLGMIIHLERQRKLRRNRRSILDDGFKLMPKNNQVI